MLRTLVAVALIAGCGDNLTKVEWWADSARMRARAWATQDGFRYLFGWRDTELGTTCDAGAPACAPRVSAYFSDAACRELVVAAPGELPPVAYFVDGAQGTARGVFVEEPFAGTLYAGWRGCVRVGESAPGFSYARAQGTTAVALTQVEDHGFGARYAFPDLAYVSLAHPALLDDGAATGSIHVEDGPGRLRTRFLLDGELPLAAGIFDAALDTTCTPAPDAAGALRCVPPLRVPVHRDAFADAACSQPIGAPLYAAPGFAAEGDGYLRVDAPFEAPAFARAGDLCLPATPPLWRATDPVDAAAFEPMFVEEVAR